VTALPADVAAWVTPSLAFVAAAVSGLTTALHPSKRAADHCMAAADWDVLAADCRIFSAVVPTLGSEEAETEFKSLEARYRTLRGSSENDE
jgi:hypothetical protein